ncbi:GNAT family N-acetyltransferase [Diaminobutyricibacter sp. McL0608]|uniref:GNAT family N-acetyltransferase n=1 Tax=Leifsonia sp. McL0608 TaxID=3143537 RepID=UPI0031F331C7
MDEPHTVEVVSAVGHYDGFFEVVGVKKPGGGGCWCMSYRDTRLNNLERPLYMEDECSREPGPGVLAYVDGEPAGWCSIAPRSSYRRLMHSRTIPFLDERDAWAAVCFVVRPRFRGRGLMNVLLDGAVEHARSHGAEVVEGYPIESDTPGKVDIISGYVGTTRLFERAGFQRASETLAHSGGRARWIMRKEFA